LKLRPRSNAELGAIDEIDPSGNDPFHTFELFAADRPLDIKSSDGRGEDPA
jgi:hypothetical protein